MSMILCLLCSIEPLCNLNPVFYLVGYFIYFLDLYSSLALFRNYDNKAFLVIISETSSTNQIFELNGQSKA